MCPRMQRQPNGWSALGQSATIVIHLYERTRDGNDTLVYDVWSPFSQWDSTCMLGLSGADKDTDMALTGVSVV